ncbi:TPA: hypothetical protein ACMDV7_003024 [Vibrio parahaemolyticus]|nr:hypothetical protein [Vibrio parahaemolyticus]
MESKPILLIMNLFDVGPLVSFFIAAAGSILAFMLGVRAFEMAVDLLNPPSWDNPENLSRAQAKKLLRKDGLSKQEIDEILDREFRF